MKIFLFLASLNPSKKGQPGAPQIKSYQEETLTLISLWWLPELGEAAACYVPAFQVAQGEVWHPWLLSKLLSSGITCLGRGKQMSLWPEEARRSWGCTKMWNGAGWPPFLASGLFPCAPGVGTRAACPTPALRWTLQHLKITPCSMLQCIWQDTCEFVVTREYINGKMCVASFCQQMNILKKTLLFIQNRKHLNSS